MIVGVLAQEPISSKTLITTGALFRNLTSSMTTYLKVASQTESNPKQITASLWFNFANTTYTMGLVEIGGNRLSYIESGDDNVGDIFVNVVPASGAGLFQFAPNAAPNFTTNAWHHLFISIDVTPAAGSRVGHIWMDGVSIFDIATDYSDDSGSALTTIGIGVNGKPFGLPSQYSTILASTHDCAFYDVWVAYGVYLDPATYVPSFRDVATGRPKALGSDGSTPTGSPPTYYFTGASSGFATNRGTGQQPTVTGTLVSVAGP
jgi:hypothetical protein